MIKKVIILFFPVLFFSCLTDGAEHSLSSYEPDMKIGDTFDGSDEDYREISTGTSEKNGIKITTIKYESPENKIETTNGRITEIRYESRKSSFPPSFGKLGISWETDFYDCLAALRSNGFFVDVNYPPYSIPHSYSNGHIWATNKERVSEKYTFHFYNGELNDEGVLSPPLRSLTISKSTSFSKYENRLEYEARGVNLLKDEKKREAIAFCSLLGEENKAHPNRLDPFPTDSTKGRLILAASWEIKNRDELLSTLDRLDEGGHSQSFRDALDTLNQIPDTADILDYLNKNERDPGRAGRILFTMIIKDIPGMKERTLRAWDWGRSVSLCRWGYNAGFLTEEETWEKILSNREKILSYYNSWEDYATGYALGRMFWSSYDSDYDEYQNRANEVFRSYSQLIHREDSIWQAPWNSAGDIPALYPYDLKFRDIPIPSNKTFPFQAWKRYIEGIGLYQIGRYEDAKREFESSFQLHTTFLTPLRYIISCERKMNHPWKAEEYAERLLQILPGDYYANLALGEIYEESNDLTAGERQLEETIGLDPEKSAAYASLARLFLKQNKYDEAQILFDQYDENVNEENVNDYAHLLRGFLYYDLKSYDRAIDYFMRCYESYEKNGQINMLLGNSFLQREDPEYDPAYLYLKRADALDYALSDQLRDFMDWYEERQKKPRGDSPA